LLGPWAVRPRLPHVTLASLHVRRSSRRHAKGYDSRDGPVASPAAS